MTSIIALKLNLTHFNLSTQLSYYQQHKSHPSNFINTRNLLTNLPHPFQPHQPILQQYISTLLQVITFGLILYFSITGLSYLYFYQWKKSKYLPKLNGKYYILHDIKWSCINILCESFLVAGLKMLQVRYSFVYFDIKEYGYMYLIISLILHMIFDQTCTYWVHRTLHTNHFLYKHLHKIHHISIDVTPFTAFSFHPLDAFSQAIPTFISCFFFPLHYDIMLFFSFITSCWAISIHDNVPMLPLKIFLYSTHHTIHHQVGIGKLRNYGKFTAVWDRLAGTYEDPDRIQYGWVRNSKINNTFKYINTLIDKYIPDRTPKKYLKQK